jgi:hypothetical protein
VVATIALLSRVSRAETHLPPPPEQKLQLPSYLALPAPGLSKRVRIAREARDGYFIDIRGWKRPFQPIQEAWHSEWGVKPHYIRAAAEAGLFLGLQVISYWARPAANSFDWDDPEFVSRVNLSSVRFDNNLAFTNFVLHPLSGAGSYWIARVNDISIPESMLYTVASSILWEFAFEWREEVSLNDLIVTPAGGIPLGAFASELSDYLSSTPEHETVEKQTAQAVIGFPRLIHPQRPDPNSGKSWLPPDSLGFSSAFWHRFRIGYETARVDNGIHEDRLNGFQADGELVSMVGFLRPGQFQKTFAHDNFTEFHLRVGFTPTGSTNVDMRSSGTLVGWYTQNLKAGRHGPYGHALMLGLPNGLKYVERTYGQARDMFASVNLFGLSSGLWLGLGRLRTRILADGHYDFGAGQSLALPQYRFEHPLDQVISVQDVQGYAFEIGPSGRIRAEVSSFGVSLGGYVDYGRYRHIGGMDRWQERIRQEPSGSDTVLEYGAWLMVEPRWVPIYLRGALDFTERKNVIADHVAERNDVLLGASAGLSF